MLNITVRKELKKRENRWIDRNFEVFRKGVIETEIDKRVKD